MAAVTADPDASRKLYIDALGLPLHNEGGGGYFHSEDVEGSKHFGVICSVSGPGTDSRSRMGGGRPALWAPPWTCTRCATVQKSRGPRRCGPARRLAGPRESWLPPAS